MTTDNGNLRECEGYAQSLWSKCRVMIKMGAILILILIMMIPLAMIKDTLNERLSRRNSLVNEISSTWGNEQTIIGPVLVIPYTQKVVTRVAGPQGAEISETVTLKAYFLPSELKINGTLVPEVRQRGIYQAVVYDGKVEISGKFSKPSFVE